jgi:hypothetical protein
MILSTGEKAFDFTALLHTYFRCDDVKKVVVEGLKGAGKKDKVNGVLTDNALWPIMRTVNILEAHVCITRLPVHRMAACLRISAYSAMASFEFASILLY